MLGGVGFNRHLLHHWDAGVSYTRLGELEDWLSTTNVAGILSERQTTYAAAFLRLWSR
jgi:hypothetical protein